MPMSHVLVEGLQPAVPLPEREPAALRAAVARLDPAARLRACERIVAEVSH